MQTYNTYSSLGRLATLILPLLACAVVGCGSSGPAKLTKAQLISKANAACQTLIAGTKAAGQRPADFTTNPTAAAAWLDKVKPVADQFVSTTKSLVPPDSLKTAWGHFASMVATVAHYLDLADTKAHAKDPSGIADYNKSSANGPQIRAAAAAVGASTCA